jgi:hypothetical protein
VVAFDLGSAPARKLGPHGAQVSVNVGLDSDGS